MFSRSGCVAGNGGASGASTDWVAGFDRISGGATTGGSVCGVGPSVAVYLARSGVAIYAVRDCGVGVCAVRGSIGGKEAWRVSRHDLRMRETDKSKIGVRGDVLVDKLQGAEWVTTVCLEEVDKIVGWVNVGIVESRAQTRGGVSRVNVEEQTSSKGYTAG